MDKHTSELVSRIETFCAARGMAETTFGNHAVNDGKLVARLRAGKTITLKTLQAIEATLTPNEAGAA